MARIELTLKDLAWLGQNENNYFDVYHDPMEYPRIDRCIKGNWSKHGNKEQYLLIAFDGTGTWKTTEIILSSSLRCQDVNTTLGLLLTMGIK